MIIPSVSRILVLFGIAAAFRCCGDEPSKSEYFDSVSPLLRQHCVECHGSDDPAGGIALDSIDQHFADETELDRWQRVLEQLELGTMPPDGEAIPDADQTRKAKAWITSQIRAHGQTPLIEQKLRSPDFGNKVSHQKLFDGSQTGPAWSPPRLWRLSPFVYDRWVDSVGENLRREVAIHQPFGLNEEKGQIADYSASHFADSATLQLLMMNCRTIAEYQTTGVVTRDHEGKLRRVKRTPRPFESLLRSESVATRAKIEAAIEYEYQLVLERRPTPDEKSQLADFCARAIETGGNTLGLQTTLQAILMKPESVYRMEIGLGPEDQHGRRRLGPSELAFALARALMDKGPTAIEVSSGTDSKTEKKNLLQIAMEGGLSDRESIRRVVMQILNENDMSTANYRMFTEDHQVRNIRVLRFFRDFFGYHHAPRVFKDAKRIGFGDRYRTDRMVDDADQLVMHLFDEDQDVLARLLTTDRYFVAYLGSPEHIAKDMHYIRTNKNDANFRFNTEYVNKAEAEGRHPIPIEGPDARRYVDFYNLDHETWDYPVDQPFRLPGEQRVGILTHPAWLIAWSGNFDNDPIRRGKWIREHLLADSVPDIPLNVDAVVPEDPHKTLRERLSVTRQQECWKCHRKMDPLGLPFECYDDFGRHREREMVGDLLSIFPERHVDAETRPVVTGGEIVESGESTLDGKVTDVRDLMNRLAGSERARQSFVRHAFRYWMGRNETLVDSPTLIAADRAYTSQGGSMKAMIASLLSSDSFLYRKAKWNR